MAKWKDKHKHTSIFLRKKKMTGRNESFFFFCTLKKENKVEINISKDHITYNYIYI
jgi:hypothetical protein